MQFWKRTCNNIFVFCLFVIYSLGRLLPFTSASLKGFGVRMGPHNTAYRKAIVQFEISEVNCVSYFYNQMQFFSWSLKNAPVDMYKAQTIRLKFYVGVFIYSSILLCTNDTLQHPVPYHVKHHIFNRTINDWSIKIWSSCITNLTHTDISCPICQYI